MATTEKLPARAYTCVKVASPLALVMLVLVLPSPYVSMTFTLASLPAVAESTTTVKVTGSIAVGVSVSIVKVGEEEDFPISTVSIALGGRYCTLPACKADLALLRINPIGGTERMKPAANDYLP